MKKLLFPLMLCFLACSLKAQEIDIQLRYFSGIHDVYPRIEASMPLSKKISISGTVSEDAPEMYTVCTQYKISDGLKAKAGIGYHKQNGIHGIFGIKTKMEKKNFEFEGYLNAYVDHVSLYASEFDFFRKFSKFDIGVATDIEYGKFFPLWKKVKPEIVKEKLLLVGPVIRFHINKKISVKIFSMVGQEQIGFHSKEFAFKIGTGFAYTAKH